jgi:Na+(H+)/acetate symporter ActP
MIGMLQILTYLLALYLVMKGIEILQIGLASARQNRSDLIAIGVLSVIVCIAGASFFVVMQDNQAQSVSSSASTPHYP